MNMNFRIGLLRPAACARYRSLSRAHNFAAKRDLGTVELLLAPFRGVVRVNPAAPRSALFHGHCISSALCSSLTNAGFYHHI
jgi:hypothetical protein